MKSTCARITALTLCLLMLVAIMPATAMAASSVSVNAGVSGSSVTVTPLSGTGYVKTLATVYSQPKTSSDPVVQLSRNIAVTFLGESGDFYQITYKNSSGKEYVGFVQKSKITLDVPAAVSSGSSSSSSSSSGSNTAPRSVSGGKSQPSATVSKLMADAKAKNSDVIGYIYIAGTNIQQPIMISSTKDVHYYTNHNLSKKKDSAGMAYSFYNTLYRNNIVTGHNMRGSNRLFHQLHHIQEKALGYSQCQHKKCPSRDLSNVPDIKQASNRVWEISLHGYNKWEIWAMYEVPKNEPKATINYNINPLKDDSQTTKFIETQKGRSEINFGTSVSAKDTLLTIYTCGTEYDSSSAQSRLYFFLKAVS